MSCFLIGSAEVSPILMNMFRLQRALSPRMISIRQNSSKASSSVPTSIPVKSPTAVYEAEVLSGLYCRQPHCQPIVTALSHAFILSLL